MQMWFILRTICFCIRWWMCAFGRSCSRHFEMVNYVTFCVFSEHFFILKLDFAAIKAHIYTFASLIRAKMFLRTTRPFRIN